MTSNSSPSAFQAALDALSTPPTAQQSPAFQTFSSSSTVPCRRASITYSEKQRQKLEEYYHQCRQQDQKPGQIVRLSYEIGLTKEQIRGWLRNRRRRGSYKGKIYHPIEHVLVLEWVFTNHTKYPSKKFKKMLSRELKMTYAQIKIWFQSRRQRGKPILLTRDYDKDPLSDAGDWIVLKDRVQRFIEEEIKGGKKRKVTASPSIATSSSLEPSLSVSPMSSFASSPLSSPSTLTPRSSPSELPLSEFSSGSPPYSSPSSLPFVSSSPPSPSPGPPSHLLSWSSAPLPPNNMMHDASPSRSCPSSPVEEIDFPLEGQAASPMSPISPQTPPDFFSNSSFAHKQPPADDSPLPSVPDLLHHHQPMPVLPSPQPNNHLFPPNPSPKMFEFKSSSTPQSQLFPCLSPRKSLPHFPSSKLPSPLTRQNSRSSPSSLSLPLPNLPRFQNEPQHHFAPSQQPFPPLSTLLPPLPEQPNPLSPYLLPPTPISLSIPAQHDCHRATNSPRPTLPSLSISFFPKNYQSGSYNQKSFV